MNFSKSPTKNIFEHSEKNKAALDFQGGLLSDLSANQNLLCFNLMKRSIDAD